MTLIFIRYTIYIYELSFTKERNLNMKEKKSKLLFILILVILLVILFVLFSKVMKNDTFEINNKTENKVSAQEENDIEKGKVPVDIEEITKDCKNAYNTYNRYDSTYTSSGKLYYKPDFEYINDDSKIAANSYGMEYYVKTNESYENYYNTMLKIVSKRFFEDKLQNNIKNVNGTLYLLQGGGFTYEYKDIMEFDLKASNDDYTELTYNAKIIKRYDDGAPSVTTNGTLSFIKQDGKYVVDQINLNGN